MLRDDAEEHCRKQPSPPWVVFQWGSFSTARFTAYVSSVDATYSLFGTTGVPIRATCSCACTRSRARPWARTRRPARSPRGAYTGWWPVTHSSRWPGASTATPAAWRSIAEANGIDDPCRLKTGTELVLPAAEEVRF